MLITIPHAAALVVPFLAPARPASLCPATARTGVGVCSSGGFTALSPAAPRGFVGARRSSALCAFAASDTAVSRLIERSQQHPRLAVNISRERTPSGPKPKHIWTQLCLVSIASILSISSHYKALHDTDNKVLYSQDDWLGIDSIKRLYTHSEVWIMVVGVIQCFSGLHSGLVSVIAGFLVYWTFWNPILARTQTSDQISHKATSCD